MTKSTMISEILAIMCEYAPVLEACGIKHSKYKQEFETRTVPQIKEGLQWLEARAAVIKGYTDIRKLLSEEIWEQYKHMDTEDFREVVLLNEAIAKIKKAFVGRPALFRKVKDGSKCKRSSPIEG